MPTHYVEDYDGKKNADAAEPVVLNPVFGDAVDAKVVKPAKVEDKAVKPPVAKSYTEDVVASTVPAKKTAAKKTAAKKAV